MLKNINRLTESDKKKFYEAMKADFDRNYNVPWTVIEERMRSFLDQAFDDRLFPKMSPDDQIDASYCRKAFNNKKPSLYDYMIWQSVFVTHVEYIEIPD